MLNEPLGQGNLNIKRTGGAQLLNFLTSTETSLAGGGGGGVLQIKRSTNDTSEAQTG